MLTSLNGELVITDSPRSFSHDASAEQEVYAANFAGDTYFLSSRADPSARLATAAEALDKWQRELSKQFDSSMVISSFEYTSYTSHARELKVALTTGEVKLRCRAVVADGRRYLVTVYPHDDVPRDDVIDRFFFSFKVLSVAKRS